MKETRRRLLQQAALASGAAALLARKAAAEGGPAWQRLFPAGFRNERIKTSGAEINTVIGGSGPPVLLFHGAPQSLITWRLIAPDLAKDYTLVMCDLRGYGDSSRPPGGGDHSDYSKRPMALDGVEVMKHLGYDQFRMVGHDRGGRVADAARPARSSGQSHETGCDGHRSRALLVRPRHHRFRAGVFLLVQRSASGAGAGETRSKRLPTISWRAPPTKYSLSICGINTDMASVHAMCEDYRASASIDLKIDEADIKAGKRIQCPLLVLVGGCRGPWASFTMCSTSEA